MSGVLVAPSCFKGLSIGKGWKQKVAVMPPWWQCGILISGQSKLKPLMIKALMVNPSSYSSIISTDVPLYEVPGVPSINADCLLYIYASTYH